MHPRVAIPEPPPRDRRAAPLRTLGFGLLSLLAAAGGEWIVHQLQYLIEYGSRFGAEMASSPHRLYMAPLGSMLAVAALLVLAVAALTLQVRAGRRRSLLQRLPHRLHHAAGVDAARVTPRQVLLIALALLACQVAIYVTQENLEAASSGLPLPGLAVLAAGSHWTVLPLHALLALGNALILATLLTWLTTSRRALRVVSALVRLLVAGRRPVPVLGAARVYLPCLRLSAGRLGLRSPPLH